MGFNLSRAAEAKNPFALPDPGLYYGYVDSGKVKTSTAGNQYIAFKIDLKDMEGNKKGAIFWNFMDADWFMYQASKFLIAAGFDMQGEMELEDIAKLAEKATVLVAVRIDPGKNGYSDKAVPDFNTWHGFYPENEVDHWDAIINQHKSEDEAPALPVGSPNAPVSADSFINPPEGAPEEEEY